MFLCPVCCFDKMPDPPQDYNICPCCGTEFGYDDEFKSFAQLRQEWITGGMRWFFHNPPPFWSGSLQLARITTSCIAPVHYLAGSGISANIGLDLFGTSLTNAPITYGFASSYGYENPVVTVYTCFDLTAPLVSAANDEEGERFDLVVASEDAASAHRLAPAA
jgi:hypothetical protein